MRRVVGSSSLMIIGVRINTESSSDDQSHMAHGWLYNRYSCVMCLWPSDALSVYAPMPMIINEGSRRILVNYDHSRAHKYEEFIGWSNSHDTWLIVQALFMCHVTLVIRWTSSICAHAKQRKWGEPCDTPQLWPLPCVQILRDHWVTKVTWHMDNGFTGMQVSCDFDHPMISQYLCARQWS